MGGFDFPFLKTVNQKIKISAVRHSMYIQYVYLSWLVGRKKCARNINTNIWKKGVNTCAYLRLTGSTRTISDVKYRFGPNK